MITRLKKYFKDRKKEPKLEDRLNEVELTEEEFAEATYGSTLSRLLYQTDRDIEILQDQSSAVKHLLKKEILKGNHNHSDIYGRRLAEYKYEINELKNKRRFYAELLSRIDPYFKPDPNLLLEITDTATAEEFVQSYIYKLFGDQHPDFVKEFDEQKREFEAGKYTGKVTKDADELLLRLKEEILEEDEARDYDKLHLSPQQSRSEVKKCIQL